MVLRGSTEFMLHRHNSFELYGADFMVDETYHPWLIEVTYAEIALHYGTKPGHSETKILFSTSKGVSGASDRANGLASGPVLTSRYLVDPQCNLSPFTGSSRQAGHRLGFNKRDCVLRSFRLILHRRWVERLV